MRRLRLANKADARELALLSEKEYDRWTEADFIQTIAQKLARVWVCEEEGKLLGFAACYFDDCGAELNQITVDADRRREHIASDLLDALFAFLKENAIPQVILEVRSGNHVARELYKKSGFHEIHTVREFYRNPPDDAVKMIRRF